MKELQKEYERIQKYASRAKMGNYSMMANEMKAIYECSADTFDLITLAFKFGFAKGCRKTRKTLRA